MIRRFVLAGAIAIGASIAAPSAHAMYCDPIAADVCATYGFVCSRLAAHDIGRCTLQ